MSIHKSQCYSISSWQYTQQRFFWLPIICQSLSRHLELISELINNQFQFSSVTLSCLTLWDPTDCCMPGFPGWFWKRLKAGGEGDDREWDGWMASPTQWTWVWARFRSWWWTGKPAMLQSTRSQSDITEQLNWTEINNQQEKIYVLMEFTY